MITGLKKRVYKDGLIILTLLNNDLKIVNYLISITFSVILMENKTILRQNEYILIDKV
jgi:hypothetical protein